MAMTIRNLDKMFSPKSVAFFGASDKDATIGMTVTRNLLAGGFKGPIWLINLHHKIVAGQTCYHNLKALPGVPDLAIIATPPATVPGIIKELGEAGTKACVVITAGVGENHNLRQKMLEAARPSTLRIMGTNCFGLLVPGIGLNASFSHMSPQKGSLAFLSQSGAIIGSVIDWADDQNIGFSHIASLGNMDDVDVGDMLDFMAMDRNSSAILMYLEQITNPRKFMSAARAASRIKPVIVIKAGRHEEGAKAAASHTGAMAGSDEIYNAAFHRAGVLRVAGLEEMFNAAEIIGHGSKLNGDRLTIISNGGGAGVLAVDCLMDCGGTLATLTSDTIAKLNKLLPDNWSGANPVDLIGDAGPDRYELALNIIAQDKNTDAVLVMNCPTALTSSTGVALSMSKGIKALRQNNKAMIAAWLGGDAAQPGRDILTSENIPTYQTPEDAVQGFSYLRSYRKLQDEIMKPPPAMQDDLNINPAKARQIIEKVLKSGRSLLTELEAKDVLSCYGITIAETYQAGTPQEVRRIATEIQKKSDHNIVVKILSEDITHKSDVGGVSLNISSPLNAEKAASDMIAHIRKMHPDAKVSGFTVQPMVEKQGAYELIVGIVNDKTFGPAILFGHGGTEAEIVNDKAVDLVPLDLRLASDMMKRTDIYKLLQGYRNHPAVNLHSIAMTLIRLSQVAVDCPEIEELDINPLLVDEKGVIALDGRIIVKAVDRKMANSRLAIRPYPKHWEKEEILPKGETIIIRPIHPEDERYFANFMEMMEPEDVRQRFFSPLRALSHDFIAQMTQIDYSRAMAFVAIDQKKDEMLGVARLHADPDYVRAEYAAMVRSDKKSRGIGWALMSHLIEYAAAEHIEELWGEVLSDNAAFLKMCTEFGFLLKMDKFDPYIINTSLKLENLSEPQLRKQMP
jgi:acetyltransferase